MKRKMIAAVLALAMLLMAGVLQGLAGQDDSKIEGNELELLIAPDPYEENAYGLRGFAASADGTKLYMGYLHGPFGDEGHVAIYDSATIQKLGEIKPQLSNDFPISKTNYYAKGLAVDNRGFLFVGLTHAETPYVSIYCYDNYLNEIGHLTEDLGNVTGINGIATYKSGDRILLYVLTCYSVDTLRCYDVTNPTDIKLNTEFGDNGVVDYNALTGSERDPGYIAVDVDGNIYITCLKLPNEGLKKGSHVLKLSPDGKSIVAEKEIMEAYGICTAGDYLFVSTYNYGDSEVVVLNKSDLSEVGTMDWEGQIWSLTSLCYGGDHLYVADQGEEVRADAGHVLRTKTALSLTRDARETEKMDPGEYEIVPTAEPSEEGDAESKSSGGLGTTKIVILSICAAVLVAGIMIVAVRLAKKKKS